MFKRIGEIAEHAAAIYDLQYDKNNLYSASSDSFVARWNTLTLEQDKFAIKNPATPYTISYLSGFHLLAVGLANGSIHLFDLIERKEIKEFALHKTGVFTLEFIKPKQWLFAGDADGLVSIYSISKLSLLIRIPLNCGKIRSVVFIEERDELIIGGQNGKIYAVCCKTMNSKELTFAHDGGIGALVYLPSQHQFVSGGKDGYLRVWDKNFNLLQALPAHNYMIYDFLFWSDDIIISASRDKSMKIWDTKTWKVIQKLDIKENGHRHSVNKMVRISSEQFASCSDDRRILIWQVKPL